MHLQRIQSYVFSVLLLGLSACSGGSDTETPPPATLPASPAEGLWTEPTNNDRTVTGVVLNDGVYWFLYSVANNPSIIAGVVVGDSSTQNGVLLPSNATDFSVERIPSILNPTVEGTYTAKQILRGTITYPASPQIGFSTEYKSIYESAADINDVVGNYIGPVALNETASVNVSQTGSITGNSATGCTFSGFFKPRKHGNVFDVTITFDGQNTCSNGSGTVKGVGFLYNNKLYSAALNDDKSNGVVFIGTKQ
ncbi:MAG: hypothetical protein QM706_06925 [Nitrospira sp.]